jgi:hypothetical protein
MFQYGFAENKISYAFAKYAVEQANLDLKTFQINTKKILKESNYKEKVY